MAEVDRLAVGAMPLQYYLDQSVPPLAETVAPPPAPAAEAPQGRQEPPRRTITPEPTVDAAEAFRTRCRQVVSSPWAWGRSRQALRMLLAAPSVTDATLKACLRAVQVDHAADASALVLPTATEGDKAVIEETRRMASILNSPQAQGREQVAIEMALGGVPVAQALTLLAGMPRTPAIPTIAERAAAEAEIGSDNREAGWGRKATTDEMWRRAVENVNKGIG